MDTTHAIERLQVQLTIAEIEELFDDGGTHLLVGCYRASSGFYVISCTCGWRQNTGKSASQSHALLRAHVAGHKTRTANDGVD